jgi:hypothetical protein
VFITAVPITKLFAWGEGHVLRETTTRGLSGLVCPSRTSERGGNLKNSSSREICSFIHEVTPRPRAPTRPLRLAKTLRVCVDWKTKRNQVRSVCVFITAGPMIKLCAGGEGDSGGHVL